MEGWNQVSGKQKKSSWNQASHQAGQLQQNDFPAVGSSRMGNTIAGSSQGPKIQTAFVPPTSWAGGGGNLQRLFSPSNYETSARSAFPPLNPNSILPYAQGGMASGGVVSGGGTGTWNKAVSQSRSNPSSEMPCIGMNQNRYGGYSVQPTYHHEAPVSGTGYQTRFHSDSSLRDVAYGQPMYPPQGTGIGRDPALPAVRPANSYQRWPSPVQGGWNVDRNPGFAVPTNPSLIQGGMNIQWNPGPMQGGPNIHRNHVSMQGGLSALQNPGLMLGGLNIQRNPAPMQGGYGFYQNPPPLTKNLRNGEMDAGTVGRSFSSDLPERKAKVNEQAKMNSLSHSGSAGDVSRSHSAGVVAHSGSGGGERQREMILMRGLPGSGKTTLARFASLRTYSE